jgi:hypothetical protein
MTDTKKRSRRVAGLFLGIGIALTVLGASGTRPGVQRGLYLSSGVLFIVAAVASFRKTDNGDAGRKGGNGYDPTMYS